MKCVMCKGNVYAGTDPGRGLKGAQGPPWAQKQKKKIAGYKFPPPPPPPKKNYRLRPPLVFSSGPPPKNHELLAQLANPGGNSP